MSVMLWNLMEQAFVNISHLALDQDVDRGRLRAAETEIVETRKGLQAIKGSNYSK